MKFVEIVETIEALEKSIETLSESKLDLLETIIKEGAEIEFDASHYIINLVEFVNSYTDEEAGIIAESIHGADLLEVILESITKNPSNLESFLNEARSNISFEENDESDADNGSVSLLSIVTNTLTEMVGEEAVENMPAEMVFDIVESVKDLELSVESDATILELVSTISSKLEESIHNGTIDFDSDDYNGETLSEFLSDYSDTEDLLTEMTKISDEILSEATDATAANLLRKAKNAIVILEAKMEKCPAGDKKCMMTKGKRAKEYYAKHTMPGGLDPKEFKLNALEGKLSKYVQAAAKAARKAGKALTPDYIQFVLVPGIIKRMRYKNRRMNAKSKIKKVGMK